MEEGKKILFDADKLHLVDVRILSGSINSPFEFDTESVDHYDLDMNYDTGFNLGEDMVKSEFTISVKTESKNDQEEATGSFKFAFVFNVENLSDLAVHEGDKKKALKVDSNLSTALASLTYSTARGILLTRFKGTVLNDFILPIIQPTNLLKR